MTQFFDAIPVPVPDHSRELQRLIPVPESREWNLSFPFPFPKIGNGICHSRSHSQKLGMLFFIPVPVPKIWEWVEQFPFPFPKSKNHSRSPLGSSKCCVSPLELCIICLILPSLYVILVATLIAFLHHRGELAISLYL